MKPRKRMRPSIPEYGIEQSEDGMLNWEFVENIMSIQHNYWISTSHPDGRPHATPIWGSWLENRFYFGGGPKTRKAKNLTSNPYVVVHTESGDEVVIVEGRVSIEQDEEVIREVQHDFKTKYHMDHPPPFWRVDPTRVFAWTQKEFAKSPTKWVFETD